MNNNGKRKMRSREKNDKKGLYVLSEYSRFFFFFFLIHAQNK
jgi:hypothetical protein